MSQIPDPELNQFLEIVDRAAQAAGRGELVAGHDALQRGLRCAIVLLRSGERWTPELLQRYREAIRNYCREYGVKIETVGEERDG